MTRVFPELSESEDEKIMKALIKYLNSLDNDEIRYGVSFKDMRAWLEKQGEKGIVFRDTFGYEEGRQRGQEEGIMLVLDNPQKYGLEKQEQKPCVWDDFDNKISTFLYAVCANRVDWSLNGEKSEDLYRKALDWLKSLKDRVQPLHKQEWSEQDEYNKRQICRILKENGCSQKLQEKISKWLVSIRPNHWKPSDEQMKALDIAIRAGIQLGTWEEKALRELKEQLKSL